MSVITDAHDGGFGVTYSVTGEGGYFGVRSGQGFFIQYGAPLTCFRVESSASGGGLGNCKAATYGFGDGTTQTTASKLVSVPPSSGAAGSIGQVAVDANYVYFYTGAQWKRAPLTFSTW